MNTTWAAFLGAIIGGIVGGTLCTLILHFLDMWADENES